MFINKRWLQREVITAVHDDDLETFLSSIGILEKIIAGQCFCAVCNNPIDLDNLAVVYSKNNVIQAVCSRSRCLADIDSAENTNV